MRAIVVERVQRAVDVGQRIPALRRPGRVRPGPAAHRPPAPRSRTRSCSAPRTVRPGRAAPPPLGLSVAGGVELLDVARRGDGGRRRVAHGIRDLAHVLAAHVARDIHARNVRFHALVGDQKALRVLGVAVVEDLAVGHEADVDEDAADVESPLLVGLDVAQLQPLGPCLVAADLLDHRVPDGLDLGIASARSWSSFCARHSSRRWMMYTFDAVAGQEGGFFDSAVTAADDRQHLFLEEGAVADRALADAARLELGLARHADLARHAAGGHDDRLGHVLGAVVGLDDAAIAAHLDARPPRPR